MRTAPLYALLLSLGVSTLARGQSADVAPAVVAALAQEGTAGVLALYDDYPDLSAANSLATKEEKGAYVHAALRQNASRHAPLLASLRDAGFAYEHYWIANAVYVPAADAAAVASMARSVGVTRVVQVPRAELEVRVPSTSPLQRREPGPEWGLVYLDVPSVWAQGVRGAGVTIAGQDTGYDWTHPALRSKYRGVRDAPAGTPDSLIVHDYNWHDAIRAQTPNNTDSNNRCGYDSDRPCDDGSHGTHTMGTMVGSDAENETGVAPEANWIGCRNMDRGDGTAASYLECFQWFLAPTDLNGEDPRPELAPDVIANSWSCPLSEGCDSTTYAGYDQAVAALRAAGVVVVVSAGNSGPDCNTVSRIPAGVAGAISVGAHRMDGELANFSSRGSLGDSVGIRPSVAAPGVAVRSTVPDSGYASFSGTSMAGPHVAGVVALMISANPALAGQVDTIEAMLLRTADAAAAPAADAACSAADVVSPNASFGYGRVNAAAAVGAAQAYAGSSTPTREALDLRITVGPNPVGRGFDLVLPEDRVGASLFVTDGIGRVVERDLPLVGRRTTVYTGDWVPGVYYYRVVGAGGAVLGAGSLVK